VDYRQLVEDSASVWVSLERLDTPEGEVTITEVKHIGYDGTYFTIAGEDFDFSSIANQTLIEEEISIKNSDGNQYVLYK
jgi:hypothetical protein